MNARQGLLLALVLVAILFAIGVVAGTRAESGASAPGEADSSTWPDRLARMLSAGAAGEPIPAGKVRVEPESARLDDSTLALKADQAVRLKVGRDSTREFRSLVLKVESGSSVRVTMSIDGEEQSKTFQAGEQTTITWQAAGGEVALVASGPARMRLD